MPREGYPNDTLSKDDMHTLAKVRQNIWSSAFVGGGFGVGSGLVLHTGAQWARRLGLTTAPLNRNTLMLSVLGGGALGMFLFSVAAGKEQVHNLHPIFQVGAVPPGELDRIDYQRKMRQSDSLSPDDLDVKKMQEIRLTRRRSMMDGFQKGHGLSDSHGGHWYNDEQK